jgi:hypothetical protein
MDIMSTFLNSHIQQSPMASRMQSQLRKIMKVFIEFGLYCFYIIVVIKL